jgi:hypothetical protein
MPCWIRERNRPEALHKQVRAQKWSRPHRTGKAELRFRDSPRWSSAAYQSGAGRHTPGLAGAGIWGERAPPPTPADFLSIERAVSWRGGTDGSGIKGIGGAQLWHGFDGRDRPRGGRWMDRKKSLMADWCAPEGGGGRAARELIGD